MVSGFPGHFWGAMACLMAFNRVSGNPRSFKGFRMIARDLRICRWVLEISEIFLEVLRKFQGILWDFSKDFNRVSAELRGLKEVAL